MIFLSVLTSFVLNTFDVTIVTCDATWLDRAELEQMIGAELAELDDNERQGMILTIDHCEEATIRLRVSNRSGQKARDIRIDEIPKEMRMRTVVLALAELAGAPADPSKETTAEKRESPSLSNENPLPKSEPPPIASPTRADSSPTPQPQCVSTAVRDRIGFLGGIYLRGFLLAKTLAPELRLGIHTRRYRVELGGYGMGWTSSLGTAYLTAATVTAGPTLVGHQGRTVALGLDALAEIGVVVGFGKAKGNSEHTPKFNIAAGGHLSFWIALTRTRRVQPVVMLNAGWLRGFYVFIGETKKGGFEGPSVSAGIAIKL
jgi:hypothetical protein